MSKFLIAILLMLAAVPAFADTCKESGCHSDITDYAVMHSPAIDDDCTVCHMADEEYIDKHMDQPDEFNQFESPVGEDENLCLMCHESFEGKEVVHQPVADGDCTVCHSPHGGEADYFLAEGAEETDTCFMCHDNDKNVLEYVHGPVAAGECSVCHDPHASDHSSRLRAPKNELCLSCHSDKQESMNASFQHQPVLEDCTTCHNPHNSEYEMFLTNDIKEICFDCHSDIGDRVKEMEYVHAPVEYDGCAACHNVHGSENPYILYENFPETFYNDYNDDLYTLCFECHTGDNIRNAVTDSETEFRNGTQNLHFLHVKMDKKGRSCKSCHEVHASAQPLHIRKSVPFGTGGWELPIKYTQTENGGSCVVGCHKPKSYDRVQKAENK